MNDNILIIRLLKYILKRGFYLKLSWILWWVLTVIELGSFITISLLLWFRDVDATGAVQTTELKWMSIGMISTLFIIPFLTQIAWLIINIVTSKKLAPQK